MDPEALLAEVARLRGEVATLEARVEELDRLANMDSLVPVANRRGLISQLEMMIARFDRHGTPAALLFVDVLALVVTTVVVRLMSTGIAVAAFG